MRAIWSGSLSFGLINIPIKLYSAVKDTTINFDMLHEKDLSPIRYARVCKAEGIEIPYEEIVKGYEYEKGHYVVLTSEDFEKANIRLTKAIAILDFAKEEEIDPIYYEKPYYLEPDRGAEKPYILLAESLRKMKKIAIGRYVLRNREHLVVIRPYQGMIIAEQIRFKEEVRDIGELNRPQAQVEKPEIEMALALIDQLTKPFEIEDYKDTYAHELERIIKDKLQGKVPAAKGTTPQPTPVPDLMAILRKSLEEERRKKSGAKTGTA